MSREVFQTFRSLVATWFGGQVTQLGFWIRFVEAVFIDTEGSFVPQRYLQAGCWEQGGWWSRHRSPSRIVMRQYANHEGCLECQKGRSPTCLYKLRRQYGLLCRKVNLDISHSAHTGVRSSSVRKKAQCLHLFWTSSVSDCRDLQAPVGSPRSCKAVGGRSFRNFVEHVLAPLETRQLFASLNLSAFTRPSCAPSTCVELCLCCRDQGAIECLIKCNCTAGLSRAKQIESWWIMYIIYRKQRCAVPRFACFCFLLIFLLSRVKMISNLNFLSFEFLKP